MSIEQVKRDAIAHLRAQGKVISNGATMAQIVYAIQGKSLASGLTAFVIDWVRAQPPLQAPVIAPAPYRRGSHGRLSWRPMRMDEINRDQPPMITPNGIGNDKQPGGFAPVVW